METCDKCGPAVKAYWELKTSSDAIAGKTIRLLTFCNHCWTRIADTLSDGAVFKYGYFFNPLDSYEEYHAWSLQGKLARGGE